MQSRLFYSTWLIFWTRFKMVGLEFFLQCSKNHLSQVKLVYKAFHKEMDVSTPITSVFQPGLARCFELNGSQCHTNPALTALQQEVLVTAGLTKICHLFTTVGWMSAKNLAPGLSITSVHLAQRLLTGLRRHTSDYRYSLQTPKGRRRIQYNLPIEKSTGDLHWWIVHDIIVTNKHSRDLKPVVGKDPTFARSTI